MIKLTFPVAESEIMKLHIRDQLLISGRIFCGRDAVLPRIAEMIREGSIASAPFDLEGGLIFHTAVSRAGVGPTSSNKLEIESTMGILSEAGIRMHLGKGKLKPETVEILKEKNAVYAVIPPVTALLNERTRSSRVVAFPELGMEALYELTVEDYPAVIAIAQGETIYD
ncbi:MAG: fumarate hydratase C-terminal domain-containing protein [Lachnospiraceae bacterium]|nr:fumarate hydratase C-terminal domain-containing protein [Lachnospiraceae bacterium]